MELTDRELYYRTLIEEQEFTAFEKIEDEFSTLEYLKFLLFSRTAKKKEKQKITFYFCTINPKPDVDFTTFKEACDKYFAKRDYTYVYEQRGKTAEECGKGFHIHFIHPKKTYDKNHVFRELKKHFGSLVGNDKCIDIRSCIEDWKKEKIQYMKGEKWDKNKAYSVKLNIEFRKKNFLQQIYND